MEFNSQAPDHQFLCATDGGVGAGSDMYVGMGSGMYATDYQLQQQPAEPTTATPAAAAAGAATQDLFDLNESIDSNDAAGETKKYGRVYKGGPSTFAAKETPLMSSYGLVDGRSNAELCFRQKVEFCAEFQKQEGHMQMPNSKFPKHHPKAHYNRLAVFLRLNRAFMRSKLKGEKVPQLSDERVAFLDEMLGRKNWFPPDKWDLSYNQLKQFRAKYGHCCVGAVPAVAQKEKDLVLFVSRSRANIRAYLEKERKEKATSGEGSMIETAGLREGVNAERQPEMDDLDDDDDDDDNNNNHHHEQADDGTASCIDKKRGKKRSPDERLNKFYSKEKHHALLQLQCLYLEAFEDRPEFKHRDCTLFNQYWFQGYEGFKEHRKNHPDDFIDTTRRGFSSTLWTPVQKWVNRTRKACAQIYQQDWMQQDGPAKQIFTELIETYSLVLDPAKVKEHDEKLNEQRRDEAYAKIAEIRRRSTPRGRLEDAMAAEEAAKQKVADAQEKMKEAARLVFVAQHELVSATRRVAECEAAVEDDRCRKRSMEASEGDSNKRNRDMNYRLD